MDKGKPCPCAAIQKIVRAGYLGIFEIEVRFLYPWMLCLDPTGSKANYSERLAWNAYKKNFLEINILLFF